MHLGAKEQAGAEKGAGLDVGFETCWRSSDAMEGWGPGVALGLAGGPQCPSYRALPVVPSRVLLRTPSSVALPFPWDPFHGEKPHQQPHSSPPVHPPGLPDLFFNTPCTLPPLPLAPWSPAQALVCKYGDV